MYMELDDLQDYFDTDKITEENFKNVMWNLFFEHGFGYEIREDKKTNILWIDDYSCKVSPKKFPSVHQFLQDASDIWESFRFSSNFPEGVNLEEVPTFFQAYHEYLAKKAKHDAVQKFYHLDDKYSKKDVEEKYVTLKRCLIFMPINGILLTTLLLFQIDLPLLVNSAICCATTFLSPYYLDKPVIHILSNRLLKKSEAQLNLRRQQFEKYQQTLALQQSSSYDEEQQEQIQSNIMSPCLIQFDELTRRIQNLPDGVQSSYANSLKQLLLQYRLECQKVRPKDSSMIQQLELNRIESEYNTRLSMFGTVLTSVESGLQEQVQREQKLSDIQLTLEEIIGESEQTLNTGTAYQKKKN